MCLQQVYQHAAQVAAQVIKFSPADARDLIDDMLPVHATHLLLAGEAAQQVGLLLRPGEDVATVEIVWHGKIIKRARGRCHRPRGHGRTVGHRPDVHDADGAEAGGCRCWPLLAAGDRRGAGVAVRGGAVRGAGRRVPGSASLVATVSGNGWFQVQPADRRKPRLKASLQRRSVRGISDQGLMVVIGSAWATTLTTLTVGVVRVVRVVSARCLNGERAGATR